MRGITFMNENKRIIFEKILYRLTIVSVILLYVYVFYLLASKPFSKIVLVTTVFSLLIIIQIITVLHIIWFKTYGYHYKKIKSDIYIFDYHNDEELMDTIKKNCINKGYVYEFNLKTSVNEEFTLFANEDAPFPKEKIGVYKNPTYDCEIYVDYESDKMPNKTIPGQGNTYPGYKPYLNMICGKWGRFYESPKDWVNIESTIVVIVDEWNGMLNHRLNHGGHLPFVLFCVIVKSEPGKLFIARDNRKKKRNDYFEKREELFDILDVKYRTPIGEMSYTDIKNRLNDKF